MAAWARRMMLAAVLLTGACASLPANGDGGAVRSVVEILDVDTGHRRTVHRTAALIEAPNWSRDGRTLIVNGGGRLYRLPVTGGDLEAIDTGFAQANNNDHGLSPDGRWLAISDQSQGPSRIFVVPAGGGEPRPVTTNTPSYWHGWSPDGRTLAFVGQRDGVFDLYAIPVEGGAEQRLTADAAHDDGPDYAPDGSLYFNSTRSGHMQIWKLPPGGGPAQPVTTDARYADWFPHPSPDGRWLIFLSYAGDIEGHPADQNVSLRIMPLDGSAPPRVIATLFGGQGTINTPSWSPDSRRVAFVSYRPLPPGAPPDR